MKGDKLLAGLLRRQLSYPKEGDFQMEWHTPILIYVCLLLSGLSIAWAADLPVNNAPVASAQSVTTTKDTAVEIILAGTA